MNKIDVNNKGNFINYINIYRKTTHFGMDNGQNEQKHIISKLTVHCKSSAKKKIYSNICLLQCITGIQKSKNKPNPKLVEEKNHKYQRKKK
jgi:hypothetical protein